jgi:hypothetical protein
MGVMKDPRREKINELKATIVLAELDLRAYSKEFRDKVQEKADTEEEKEARKTLIQEMSKVLSQKSAVLDGLSEELKLTRMNKRSSKNFEWHPSPPNRRMRRAMAKQRR